MRILFVLLLAVSFSAQAVELELATERIKPGIVFVFEGAVKDKVFPKNMHLAEKHTDVHIEARVNWDTKNIPAGAVAGGFIPYLRITARVINEKTGLSTFVDLLPHINLIDNFHYARNISLPGQASDKYKVIFSISPPGRADVALHKDWIKQYRKRIFKSKVFTYKHIDFKQIVEATRG